MADLTSDEVDEITDMTMKTLYNLYDDIDEEKMDRTVRLAVVFTMLKMNNDMKNKIQTIISKYE